MIRSKKKGKKSTPGNVSTVATMTSPLKSGSLGVPEHKRGEAVGVHDITNDIETLCQSLGHPPSYREYQSKGVYGHSTTFRYHGLRFFLRRLGYTVTRKSKNGVVKSPYRCFNGKDCSAPEPPNPVKGPQIYCDYCKQDRGWYD